MVLTSGALLMTVMCTYEVYGPNTDYQYLPVPTAEVTTAEVKLPKQSYESSDVVPGMFWKHSMRREL